MKASGLAAFLALTNLAWGSAPMVDLDQDGMGDVWQHRFGALGLDPDLDADGDGRSNAAEAMAGTDPFDPMSVFVVVETAIDGADLTLQCHAQPGKSYQLLSSPTLAGGAWNGEGAPQIALGNQVGLTLAKGAGSMLEFFRFEVGDVDSDGDGVPDWDELQLASFDPTVAQSAQPGQSDLATLTSRLSTARAFVTVSAIEPMAYEKESVPARFRVSRVGAVGNLTVHFNLAGNPDLQKGSASPADYALKNASDQTLGTTVVIPEGATDADVIVESVTDAINEVPEMLGLTLATDPAYLIGAPGAASVTINDAQNTPANERLLVAYLTAEAGSVTSASGLSTVRLRGDNTFGTVDLSFSGLKAIQTAVHIHAASPPATTGPHIESLELGQVVDHLWQVRAAQFLTTDQAVLDALFSGALYVNVHTASYPAGEIRGDYLLAAGSIEPPTPDAPPPIATLAGDDLTRDVARFLTQATFGPTGAEMSALVADIENNHGGDRIAGFQAWIDRQFALDQTDLLDYVMAADAQEWALRGTDPINYTGNNSPGTSNRRRGWWLVSTKAHDQLRQRVGFAMSEIFVISELATDINTRHYGAAHYVDRLAAHADGSFRSLLEEVSKSPMMGSYLSSLKNQKAVVDPATGDVLISPDENFAREVMQLFCTGLVLLHQDGSLKLGASGLPVSTYNNDDITELARVFTGWSFSKRHGSKALGYPIEDNPTFNQSKGPSYFQASWLNPMKNFAAYHDTAAKTVLGSAINAGLDGEQDLDAALDILANHPNVGPFISRLLIQRLVSSNPSAGYVYRVAGKFNDDGAGVRGNLKAVVKAILLDYEARSLELIENVGYGKQKEPLIRYVQLLRAFDGASQLPLSDLTAHGYPTAQLDNFPGGTTRYRYGSTDTNFSQSPLRSPSVFNWFLPGYNPGGAVAAAGLVAPEMLITNETQVMQSVNYGRSITFNTGGQGGSSLFAAADSTLDDVKLDRTPLDALYAAEIAAGKTVTQAVTTVVDQVDLLLMAGRFKSKYLTAPVPNPRSLLIENVAFISTSERIRSLLYLMALTPEYLHQK